MCNGIIRRRNRTGYERRSNVEHDHDESKEQRQTEDHVHEQHSGKKKGGKP